MASPASIFAIPELLEAILIEVDTKTLLLSQAVDKTFKATISSSAKLQRKLFLLAEPDHGQLLKHNDLLGTNARPVFYFGMAPALNYFSRTQHLVVMRGRGAQSGRPRVRADYKMKGGSWERMLPVQPPRAFANAIVEIGWPPSVCIRDDMLGDVKGGQTAGEIFAWVQWRTGLLLKGSPLVTRGVTMDQ